MLVVEREESELWEGGRLVWHVRYQHSDPALLSADTNGAAQASNSTPARLRHRLDINKDDVQVVLPISKVRNIIIKHVQIFIRHSMVIIDHVEKNLINFLPFKIG